MNAAAVASPERKRLLSLAYGYLGSLSEAEDVIQEALLRLTEADRASIQNTDAWLTTVVTRLSIDRLRSARHRRELYPGEWLPEPVFNAPSPEQDAITRSRLSVALLYLLEKLEPEQRIVFVLREVFEHSYAAIAQIAGKSEAACRQLMARARAAVERAQLAPPPPQWIAESILNRFIQALANGDEEAILSMLAKDAILIGDGGGKAPSVLKPICGAARITRFFLGVRRRRLNNAVLIRCATVNSGPGLMTYIDGSLSAVASLTLSAGLITGLYSVSNPEKLSMRISHA